MTGTGKRKTYDGQRWTRVDSWHIMGDFSHRKDDDGNLIWDEEKAPDYFVTVDGRVPKNMGRSGGEDFRLWPVKHYGSIRTISYRYYERMDNSHNYYYGVRLYTYWDGRLYSCTRYYGRNDAQIEYVEREMQQVKDAWADGDTESEYHPFMPEGRCVKARYR